MDGTFESRLKLTSVRQSSSNSVYYKLFWIRIDDMGWTWNRFLARRFLYLINNTFGSCNLSSLGGAIFKTAHNFVSAVNV